MIRNKYHNIFTYPIYMTSKSAIYINSGISTSATFKLDSANKYCDTANQSLLTIKLTLLTHNFKK
jgi:hypothetical protein